MSENKEVRRQFGINAEHYVSSIVHAKGASLQRLADLLDLRPEWKALDVASGTGHTAFLLAPFVSQVVATDITPEMLARAKRVARERSLSNVAFGIADASQFPHKDRAFDLVTCRIAAHHFPDPTAFVGESARVLRSGGKFALVDNVVPEGAVGAYINAFEKLRDPSHIRCLTVAEWTTIASDAGLNLQHLETISKRLDFSQWAGRHTPEMQSYLGAMLTECDDGVAGVLEPKYEQGKLSFGLTEVLFIAST
ncbi:MAG: class I SAM-dependent methyltransferase [Candidatus Promineifilaceae bacterium]